LASAARTASVLVRGFFSAAGVFVSRFIAPSVPGMIGSIWVGIVGSRSTGCILMGPVLSNCGVLLGMTVNAQPPFSFEGDG
jgi:hypothetical protein